MFSPNLETDSFFGVHQLATLALMCAAWTTSKSLSRELEVSVCSIQVKLPEGVAKGQLSIWTNEN